MLPREETHEEKESKDRGTEKEKGTVSVCCISILKQWGNVVAE